MANQITLTVGQSPRKAVLHPGDAYQEAIRNQTPTDFWGKANSITNPLGPEPGSAWMLMLQANLAELGKNSLHRFQWSDGLRVITFATSYVIVGDSCQNFAIAGDAKSARLVHFQDARRILKQSHLNKQYNVLRPAANTLTEITKHYTDSLNGGALWTWQTLVTDIWGELPTVAGTAPTLPYTPDGTPENWRFVGKSAWMALHEVLAKVGCTTSFNAITGVFSYVRLGATQTGLARSLAGLENRLMMDYDPGGSYALANIPETIRVGFRRREVSHGIELDTPDASNWEMTPVVFKDHTTGITGAQSGSVVTIWDDLPALWDNTSNTNSAALQTRADEVGSNYEAKLISDANRLRRVYSGLAGEIMPGSEVYEVRYRWYGDAAGLVTEFYRGESVAQESQALRAPPDLDDANYQPVWPRLGQPVQVDQDSGEPGDTVNPDSSGLFPGYVLTNYEGAYTQLEACWIQPLDLHSSGSETQSINLKQLDRFHGRLSGTVAGGGVHGTDVRPLYLVRGGTVTGANTYDFDITADSGGTFTIAAQDLVDFEGTGASFPAATRGRGIVTRISDATTTSTIDFTVNETVMQQVVLTGSETNLATVLVEDGTANTIQWTASTLSPIHLTGVAGDITITAHDPYHVVDGDAAGSVATNLNYSGTIDFQSPDGDFTVSGGLGNVVVQFDADASALPIGSVIMGVLKPIKVSTKWFMDNGKGTGTADQDWALMDGASNLTPGSGIMMASAGTAEEYFVRAKSHDGTTPVDANNTPAGRTAVTGANVDTDKVTVEVEDHEDHAHTVNADQCDCDITGTDIETFQFSTSGAQLSLGVLDTDGSAASAGVLGHTVTITDGQAGSGEIEMMPSHKKLYFFERVA